MQDPGLLESAAAMQQCAADRGISIPHESAQELVKRWLMQEKSAQVLKAAGQNRVLQSIRAAWVAVAPALPCAPAQTQMNQCGAGVAPPLVVSVAAKQPPVLAKPLQLQPQPPAAAAGRGRGAWAWGWWAWWWPWWWHRCTQA